MIKGINMKLNKVFRMGQAFTNNRLKEIGLSSGLFYFILELIENDGQQMQELSKSAGVDNAHTTRAISKLIDLGYATKIPNPNDARSSRVFLTQKGKDASEQVKEMMQEWIKIITEGVTENELQIVNSVFNKFYDNAKKHLDK